MCLPVAAQIALTVASGAATLYSQAQAAKAQAKAQQQASANEVKRWQHEVGSARLTEAHQDTASAMEALKGDKEANEAISTISTSAAERGIEGTSTGLAVANYMQMNANYQTALEQQAQMNRQGLSMALEGAGMGFQQNMININQPIAGPDWLGVALGTARQAQSQYGADQLATAQTNLYDQTAALRGAQRSEQRLGGTAAGMDTGLHAQSLNRFRLNRNQRLSTPPR